MSSYFTTPIGTAFYTYVFKPDVQFKEDGEFSVKLRLSGEDATKFQEKVDSLHEKSVEKAKEDNPAKKIKKAAPPYKEVTNENDEPTGELEFAIKQPAVTKTRKGPWNRTIAVFDAEGNAITSMLSIGNGSKVRASFEPYYWYTPSLGAGVRLGFRGLQIIDLIEYNPDSEDGGDSMGFGKVADGYKHDNKNNSEGASDGNESEEFFSSKDQDEEDF